MKTFEFTLHFKLPADHQDPSHWLDALFEAGCDDATVGVGRTGFIALDFAREAASPFKALSSAIAAVKRAIPGCEFVTAAPDLVGLADIAILASMTRQNLQKYATNAIRDTHVKFPAPVVLGSDARWRFAEIASWLIAIRPGAVKRETVEVSVAAAKVNIKAQEKRLELVTA
jgi:hypothetical protein